MSWRGSIKRSVRRVAAPSPSSNPRVIAAFDADWYRANYSDVDTSIDSLDHYVSVGWKEGRDPSSLFSTSWYVDQNPDVIAAGINPLEHYVDRGWEEERDPCPLFSTAWYLHKFPGRANWFPDPMTHYRTEGWKLGIKPHPLFDGDWYLSQLDIAESEAFTGDPLSHYVHGGWRRGLEPNPIFDLSWYATEYGDLISPDTDPLTHYVTVGAAHGTDPSPLFSTLGYVARYPHCGGRADALPHYLEYGRSEGLAIVHSASGVPSPHGVTNVSIDGALPTSGSIAILAGHNANGTVSLATRTMCEALEQSGIAVILSYDHVVENSTGAADPWSAIIASPHDGYDFFSWRLALEALPRDTRFDEVFMLNDSIIGPFGDAAPVIAAWRSMPFAITGLLESSDPKAHLQSWALRFTRDAAIPGNMLSLYGRARSNARKGDLIDFFEIPLAEHFRTKGHTTGSVFSHATVTNASRNPAIYGWRDLLKSGMPFVKREVFTLPDAVLGIGKSDLIGDVSRVSGISPSRVQMLVHESIGQLTTRQRDDGSIAD